MANLLTPTNIEMQPFEVPDGGVGLGDLMAHKLTFDLYYDFGKPPEFLTFTQQFTDEEAFLPSEMSLQVKQENAGTPYAIALKADEPYTLRLDWNAPPLSEEASIEEWEEWVLQQKEQTLGITSYSSVYSFLYV